MNQMIDDVTQSISDFVLYISSHAWILFFVATALIAIFFVCGICDTSADLQPLRKIADKDVRYQKKMRHRFYNCVHDIAKVEINYSNSKDFDSFEDKLYSEICDEIFGTDKCFSDNFTMFLKTSKTKYCAKDLKTAIIKYRSILASQRQQQLVEKSELDALKRNLSKSIEVIKSQHLRDIRNKQREATTETDILNAYQKHIKLIKANNGIGLMPVYVKEVNQSVIDYCEQTIVFNESLLSRVFACDYSNIDVPGCAVIYNTCTEQYLVVGFDKVYSGLEDLFSGKSIAYAETFGADKQWGHKMLSRIVPLDKSGYEDLSVLKSSLVKAYHSMAPYGYNTEAA